MRINARHVKYVVAVANTGSIRAAAKVVGISEPAVSAALKMIEDQIGYTIFIRNLSKGMSLTMEGEKFIQHSQLLLTKIEEYERAIFEENEQIRGSIRIGCYFVSAPYVIGRLLAELRSSAPELQVELHEGSLQSVVADLKSGRTHIALTYDIFHDTEISYVSLFEVRPHLIMSSENSLAGKDAISLSDVAQLPLALLDLPMSKQEYEFMNIFRLHGISPNIKYKVKNFELIRTLVGNNLAYSFGRLAIDLRRSYDGSGVVQKTIIEDLPTFKMCAAIPTGVIRSKAVEYVLNAMTRTFAKSNFYPFDSFPTSDAKISSEWGLS